MEANEKTETVKQPEESGLGEGEREKKIRELADQLFKEIKTETGLE